jgi:glycosyltransferase involved in cell wall biosynthesis
LICDRFVQFDGLLVDYVPWSSAAEARELAAAEAGIAWMPDDDWSRGKCGLKVLQYMAAGLPVIANPVGVHRELVRDGETGFLVATAPEWAAAATRLAGDPALRRRMGEAGRSVVESEYATAAGGRLWVELIARLAGETSAAAQRSG